MFTILLCYCSSSLLFLKYKTQTIRVLVLWPSIKSFLSSKLMKHFFFHTAWKSVRIRSYSGPYFPAFGLNTERYSVSLRIQSKCRKIQTRITPNTNTFYPVPETVLKPNNYVSPGFADQYFSRNLRIMWGKYF